MKLKPFAIATALAAASWLVPNASRAETYQTDPAHSSVVFRVKHMNASYSWGRFNDIAGTFTLDAQDPSRSKLAFQVKAGSIDTGQAKRDQHLKSPDFLNAVQFPNIAFVSKSVASAGGSYEVIGDLTLHGVTRPVTVKLTPTGTAKGPTGAPIAGIEASFSLKRTDFGMNNMVGPVGDDIWVVVSVEGKLQAQ